MSDDKSNPVIILTGGGSGGHITPIVAVAKRLQQLEPEADLIYIGQKDDHFADITTKKFNFRRVVLVRAGKFRRFHGEGLKQILDMPVVLKNIRDFFYVIYGTIQCIFALRKLRPSIIFIKGGYVGVPVGLAAAILGIPYITHDSDAIPGLANRIIARWARLHAVAMPKEIYNYPIEKTVTTGIPLQGEFQPVSKAQQAAYKKEIDVPEGAKLLFVIGGGLGARRVNQAVADTLPLMLQAIPDLYVIQSAGKGNQAEITKLYNEELDEAEQGRVKVYEFIDDVYRYSGAADLIVTRAGATNLAEFALQGKPCIVVPNPFLTGGHQIKNTTALKDKNAVVVINESDLVADPNRLSKMTVELMNDKDKLASLSKEFSKFARPDATDDIAKLILSNIGEV